MKLNTFGEICKSCWLDLPSHYDQVICDEFVVMPNHFHGIIKIINRGFRFKYPRVGSKPTPAKNLSEIVRGFKTFSSRKINQKVSEYQQFRWQRSFFDQIIKDRRTLYKIRYYIKTNPKTWDQDEENLIRK
jgi:REP element-mobilizing transposase RayT